MKIYFTNTGRKTSTGRALFRLCHPGGRAFGRAFCIKPLIGIAPKKRRKGKA